VKTVSWTEDVRWDDVLWQASEEDVLILRDGHPVVLITPFDDDDLACYAREHDPAFLASLARARRQVERGEVMSNGDLKKEFGLEILSGG
jgi:hypothetical protein